MTAKPATIVCLSCLFAPPLAQSVSVPPDSTSWEFQGRAKVTEYQGRKCIYLAGGTAAVKDLELRDAIIDVDAATPAERGFFGIQFRINPDNNKAALFHLRLELTGAQAKLYVKDLDKPSLVMTDLKSGNQKGLVALTVLTGATYFSNFEVRETPAIPWERHEPALPLGTLTRWSLSPSYDALQRNLEQPLSETELRSMPWQDVAAEPPGFVVINRYQPSPA